MQVTCRLDAACPAELSIPVVMTTLQPFLHIDDISIRLQLKSHLSLLTNRIWNRPRMLY